MTVDELKEHKAQQEKQHAVLLHMLMRLSNLSAELIALESVYPDVSKFYPVFCKDNLRSTLRKVLKGALPEEFMKDAKAVAHQLDLCQDTFEATINFFDKLLPALVQIVRESPELCENLMASLHKTVIDSSEPEEEAEPSILVPDVGECFPGPEPTKFN